MPHTTYDAIIVGARCAGAATALLLARAGARVLLLDRAHFPSDTISGHVIKPAGVAALDRWGLLDDLLDSGCPPITDVSVSIGGRPLPVPPMPKGSPPFIAPRRTVLDLQLVNAAAAAGVEVRERTAVAGLLHEDNRVVGIQASSERGGVLYARAPIVIGADGKHSLVAQQVDAPVLEYYQPVSIAYYSYWSGSACTGIRLFYAPGRVAGLVPTHAGQVLAFIQVRRVERHIFRADPVGQYIATLTEFPGMAEALEGAVHEGPLRGMLDLPTFFRQSYGPGWALAGDAAHHKDPLIARGISDAFRDAELLANAVCSNHLSSALAEYQELREHTSRDVAILNHRLAELPDELDEIESRLGALLQAEAAADAYLDSVLNGAERSGAAA